MTATAVPRFLSSERPEKGFATLLLSSILVSTGRHLAPVSCGGQRSGKTAVLVKGARKLPFPTIRLQVSGRNSRMAKNTTDDAIDRNQNIDDQFHLMSNSPLMSGATLGGVLRLHSLISPYFRLCVVGA
jgi:hypothetical protein